MSRYTNQQRADAIGALAGVIQGSGNQKPTFDEVSKSMGHPGLHFLDLRASALVLWMRAGIPPSTVRAMAGYASLATTDRYARLAKDDVADAAEIIKAYLSRTKEVSGTSFDGGI